MRLKWIITIIIILVLIAGLIFILYLQPSLIKTCNIPLDCGKFYDCINSKCVKIIPPSLP